MTQIEQQKASAASGFNDFSAKSRAKEFAEFWADKGDEKQESQRFWIQLLGEVLGVSNPTNYIEFEKVVKRTESRHSELVSESAPEMLKQVQHDKVYTNYIDAYIADTKVLIEQKGAKIDLHKAYEQSDGQVLTPYQQAKRYVGEMKASEKPRWSMSSARENLRLSIR